MANVYTNYKAVLSTSALTTLYTVGSETTAIIKSLRVTNTDEENDCKIRTFIVDSDSVSYTLETNRNIQKGTSEELFNSYSFSTSCAGIVIFPANTVILSIIVIFSP